MSEEIENKKDVVYFLNSDSRNHRRIYGEGAYFDLKKKGRHVSQAVGLVKGQLCVVASYANKNRTQVKFDWYSLIEERSLNDDRGRPHRVFFGGIIHSETMRKTEAKESSLYGLMFNRLGHFRQAAALKQSVEISLLPDSIPTETGFFPDEVLPNKGGFVEGAVKRVEVNAYERNTDARTDCIKHYGAKCFICDREFGKIYGPVAEGFIHVHHLKPLHEVGQEYEVDPVKDLRPVCPNCHAVIHLGGANRSINEVKEMLRKAKNPSSR